MAETKTAPKSSSNGTTPRPPKSLGDYLESARRTLRRAEKLAEGSPAANSIKRVRLDVDAIATNLERQSLAE